MSKQSTSREEMFSKIREWQQSGLSQKMFCEECHISYSNFHYWYKRFRELDSTPSSGFVPLQISGMSTGIFASVVFSRGYTLQIHQAVSADFIKELLP